MADNCALLQYLIRFTRVQSFDSSDLSKYNSMDIDEPVGKVYQPLFKLVLKSCKEDLIQFQPYCRYLHVIKSTRKP